MIVLRFIFLFGFGSIALLGCQSTTGQSTKMSSTTPVSPTSPIPTPLLPAPITALETVIPDVETPTSEPTLTATPPSPSPSITPSPSATVTAIPTPQLCAQRHPKPDDLLTYVSREYGLARDYEPDDLVDLADYLPVQVTKGYPTKIRAGIAQPLVNLITDMQAVGLQPFIISGYRSYAQQAVAWNKWLEAESYGAQLSAQPGHSEHQLGTTIDFGSPELPAIVGDATIEFHTWFYKTSEGAWLLEHAHTYGFSLSYPANSYETTTFYYEPWHYRYIGIDLATSLHEQDESLTGWQMINNPIPCIP